MTDEGDESNRRRPMRFSDLPDYVQDYLRDLRKADIRTQRDVGKFYTSASVAARMLRWVGLTFLLALGGGAVAGDKIAALWKAFLAWSQK